MRLHFDQIGKQIGRAALDPSGPTFAHDEIAPDAYHADLRHEPDPARAAERARLGLLGRIASVLCLIEIYSQAPGEDQVLACLGKLIAFRQKRLRSFRKKRPRKRQNESEAFVAPFLWIITAGRPTAVLTKLGAAPAAGWPPGVYFGPELLHTGIVVASELPRARDTLLLRLMAAGPLLAMAIEDLHALPEDAHERAVAEQILLNFRSALGSKASRTAEEQEFIMRMYKTWAEERSEAKDEGRVEGEARALLAVLRARGIAVPDAVRERILAEKKPSKLERWLEKAAVAASIGEVIRVRS